jgi:hypothetical protein
MSRENLCDRKIGCPLPCGTSVNPDCQGKILSSFVDKISQQQDTSLFSANERGNREGSYKMSKKKLAEKIASSILTMNEPNAKEGYRVAIMFRDKKGGETTVGGRDKQCLVDLIEKILKEYER